MSQLVRIGILWVVLSIYPMAGEAETVQAPETPASTLDPWKGARTIRGNEAPGYVAFTFDDGPNTETTPGILDTLEAFDVPATFFVVGQRFGGANPEGKAGKALLVDMEKRGFTIGNHTINHNKLDDTPFELGRNSIASNDKSLQRVLGKRVHLFRPPFGATTVKIRRFLRWRKDTVVRWSIDPRDFSKKRRKSLRKRLVAEILQKSGGVVLLHDTKPWTANLLPGILSDLQNANCERLAAGQDPIMPVSLHYFLRSNDGTPRPIPAAVRAATETRSRSLRKYCQTRDAPAPAVSPEE